MSKRIGESTIMPDNPVIISSFAAVGGIKEGQGPYGGCYDYIDKDDRFGQESFEDAENAMQGLALQTALDKRKISGSELSMMFGGDLLNQCIGTSFGVLDFKIPFIGIYGACSTMSEGLMLASLMVDSGAAQRAAAITSSHFCTAERQYRFPLEYGGQRPPTAQWTVTGAGCAVIKSEGSGVKIPAASIGTICDLGITDANNMGAAMAPAAEKTIFDFLRDSGTSPSDYDLILTGDLGFTGSKLLYELFEKEHGIDLRPFHNDCGLMIYDLKGQDVNSGGSGCGCSASVLCSHVMKEMRRGALKRVLFVATGALMSATSSKQGMPIPSIAHAVVLEV